MITPVDDDMLNPAGSVGAIVYATVPGNPAGVNPVVVNATPAVAARFCDAGSIRGDTASCNTPVAVNPAGSVAVIVYDTACDTTVVLPETIPVDGSILTPVGNAGLIV